jgi:hypothetical protein
MYIFNLSDWGDRGALWVNALVLLELIVVFIGGIGWGKNIRQKKIK